jgi:hypothetical protein
VAERVDLLLNALRGPLRRSAQRVQRELHCVLDAHAPFAAGADLAGEQRASRGVVQEHVEAIGKGEREPSHEVFQSRLLPEPGHRACDGLGVRFASFFGPWIQDAEPCAAR